MAILYIIGNGFDLHYNLKTSTEHFIDILMTKHIYNEIDNAYDVLGAYGVNWGEYEQALADIDLNEIEEQNLIMPDYMSDHEYDRDGGIYNMQMYLSSISEAVTSALEDMVKTANSEIEKRLSPKEFFPQFPIFCSGDAILSFNYTSTVEHLYNLPSDIPILHIHGFYEDGTPLIFGYKNGKTIYANRLDTDIEDADYYVDQQRQEIYDFYNGLKKDIQMDNLNLFLTKCKEVNQIVVLGHSMSQVDSDYMVRIENVLQPEKWCVYYHDNDVIMNAREYTFFSRMSFMHW